MKQKKYDWIDNRKQEDVLGSPVEDQIAQTSGTGHVHWPDYVEEALINQDVEHDE